MPTWSWRRKGSVDLVLKRSFRCDLCRPVSVCACVYYRVCVCVWYYYLWVGAWGGGPGGGRLTAIGKRNQGRPTTHTDAIDRILVLVRMLVIQLWEQHGSRNSTRCTPKAQRPARRKRQQGSIAQNK